MTAHTPGPWFLSEAIENRFQKTNMRRVRSANEGTEHGAVCEVYGVRDGSTAAANARLIAAAPDLLSVAYAAQEVGERIDHDPDSALGELVAAARAAIVKAKGEQP